MEEGCDVMSENGDKSIRILCASELIGSVIGKSGANVRRVEQQTGARIKVQEIDKDASGERLIIVSSNEIPTEPISPTIEALILLHDKVITEMRRRTGAEIRVYSKADKPKYLLQGLQLLQEEPSQRLLQGLELGL
ncbi:RNA-binding KH domain-containing protein RCF3-like [Zea mays]|uniref:RNA-binding KH domain-containing protein RCF3-like n=1 Tax=Zea mays TaxID=4577 RepID=UPI0009AA6FCF|nr:RNA-binding KH domain-containing protein RCF3-like [Zea mays]